MRVPAIIDTSNLYRCSKKKYGKLLDYHKFFEHLKTQHGDEVEVTAYIARQPHSDSFSQLLLANGCHVQSKELRNNKKDSFDVEIAILMLSDTKENMVLCSNSLNLVPLVHRLNDMRITTYMYGIEIPHVFRDYCVVREIPLSMMLE